MELNHARQERVGPGGRSAFAALGVSINHGTVRNHVGFDIWISTPVQIVHFGKEFLCLLRAGLAATLGPRVNDHIILNTMSGNRVKRRPSLFFSQLTVIVSGFARTLPRTYMRCMLSKSAWAFWAASRPPDFAQA